MTGWWSMDTTYLSGGQTVHCKGPRQRYKATRSSRAFRGTTSQGHVVAFAASRNIPASGPATLARTSSNEDLNVDRACAGDAAEGVTHPAIRRLLDRRGCLRVDVTMLSYTSLSGSATMTVTPVNAVKLPAACSLPSR